MMKSRTCKVEVCSEVKMESRMFHDLMFHNSLQFILFYGLYMRVQMRSNHLNILKRINIRGILFFTKFELLATRFDKLATHSLNQFCFEEIISI